MSAKMWACVALSGLWLGACHTAPVELARPPVRLGTLLARHFDQSCRVERRPPTDVRIGELFDTVGLRAELLEVGPPRPLTPPWPIYSFMTHYDRWGRPVASGTWEATVDDSTATAIEEVLRDRVAQVPGGLLEGAAFHTQVVFGRLLRFELAGPVDCLPHMYHVEGQPPLGLPANVATQGGRRRVADDDTTAAVVRIVVAPDGSVREVEGVAGSPRGIERARAVVALLRFDPALRNGVPVEGSLIQWFGFRVHG